ncbi:unnamed protein product [Rotaria magnacalcarata]|uniref:4-nitrophenylphosphatase n=1 Tax=Rotaria magnacalcarata TaxID=392030 RepID=A0A8S2L0T0_9BILA|nr:unnamed protein product [Rotaria magnacalcarata]CAF3880130.1 unnamed protein product [Rotaria magnacalcarata]
MSIEELCTHLTELHSKSLLSDNDTFLFDCDGVLWNFPQIFTGAIELLNYLTAEGKRLFFVTNNSTKTQDDYAKRFNDIGYNAKPEQIICTAWLTAQYLKSIKFAGKCYVVGMQSMKHELEREGITICGGIGADPLPPDANAVNTNKLEFDKDFLGAGSILSSIATASCRSPTILGKPHAPMFDAIRLAYPDVDPKRTVMIGDRVETDIAFGNRQGATTLLVFSGATSEKDLDTLKQQVEKHAIERDLLPNFCVKDVGQFLRFLESTRKSLP